MKIHNVRLGFATNSSSSHSVVVMPSTGFLRDNDLGSLTEFGWDNFTLVSKEKKRAYIAQQIASNLGTFQGYGADQTSNPEHMSMIERLTGIVPEPGHVDHQSVWALPSKWDGTLLDEDFFAALMKHLDREDVAVLGGNDNGDPHPDSAGLDGLGATKISMDVPREQSGYVCRDDDPHWTLFQRSSGKKVRMSFNDDAPAYTKARYPELVDVKITDYCPFGCAYCYQASTLKGEHAPLHMLEGIAEALADVRVFEVALGGGEPTMHPDFMDIVDAFARRHIITNFTTRNLEFIEQAVGDPSSGYGHTLRQCGGFAFSVDDAQTVHDLAAVIASARNEDGSHNNEFPEVAVQYVMGAANDVELERVLRACAQHRLRLTLLGFKHVGRGELFQLGNARKSGSGAASWVTLVKKLDDEWSKAYDAWSKRPYVTRGEMPPRPLPSISIDTALAAQSLEAIKEAEISNWAYSIHEGAFSMYIDAVNQQVAPSSYCSPSSYEPLSLATVMDTFATFPGELR